MSSECFLRPAPWGYSAYMAAVCLPCGTRDPFRGREIKGQGHQPRLTPWPKISHVLGKGRPVNFKLGILTEHDDSRSPTCVLTSRLNAVGGCSCHYLQGAQHIVSAALHTAQLVISLYAQTSYISTVVNVANIWNERMLCYITLYEICSDDERLKLSVCIHWCRDRFVTLMSMCASSKFLL